MKEVVHYDPQDLVARPCTDHHDSCNGDCLRDDARSPATRIPPDSGVGQPDPRQIIGLVGRVRRPRYNPGSASGGFRVIEPEEHAKPGSNTHRQPMNLESSIIHEADSVLEKYLLESDDARSNRLLVQLLCEYAEPIAKRVVTSKLGGDQGRLYNSREAQDTEDVCNDVTVQLLSRLRTLKRDGATGVLTDFSSYVAVTAYNACNLYLRRKYPERHRLKTRFRYILSRDECFALWDRDGKWVCGLAEWRKAGTALMNRDGLRALREDVELADRSARVISGAHHQAADLIAFVFTRVQNPLELDQLVTLVLDVSRIRELGRTELSDSTEAALAKPWLDDSRTGGAVQVEQRLYLRQLWSEVRALPLRQRRALLLNLRDPLGLELVTLLTEMGVASLGDIAGALDVSLEQMAQLWNRLPIEDAKIAEQMGVSRQQVINLRVSARRRLARRMNGLRTF